MEKGSPVSKVIYAWIPGPEQHTAESVHRFYGTLTQDAPIRRGKSAWSAYSQWPRRCKLSRSLGDAPALSAWRGHGDHTLSWTSLSLGIDVCLSILARECMFLHVCIVKGINIHAISRRSRRHTYWQICDFLFSYRTLGKNQKRLPLIFANINVLFGPLSWT